MKDSNQVRFDGKVVIVTGAGAGLGRAYALLFGSRGAKVVVNDLGGGRHGDGTGNSRIADSVVDEIRRNGGTAVANYDSVLDGENIVKTAIDAFGRIDIVINNAGILRDKSFIKMTDDDWDIIQNVHVKGAVKTTRAAWPYFKKQNYGRVIFTSSNSGLYGNFGQANYSSAKAGLVGLANTLAIEGGRNNIHVNVIVPTAASRLTEDILPPDLFNELKPELIAPVVVWMCHEDCTENGSVIESAIGWAGKCHLIRSSGAVLRSSADALVTPEAVQENWSKITDMSNAKHYDSIEEVTGELMSVIDGMNQMNSKEAHHYHKYSVRDAILYAIGVGATVQEPMDLRYLYENHEDFSVFPTYYVIFGPAGCMESNVLQDAFPGMEVDPTRILHGEQYLEIHKSIPLETEVKNVFKVQDVMDKGKGSVILIQCETYDNKTDEKIATGQMSVFIVGGGFKGARTSKHVIPTVEPPKRKPDVSVKQRTNVDQAAVYRLSGDLNPLHIDENIATMAGFQRPILHGLCSLGFSARHVLNTYAAGNAELFKAIKVRFAKPVLPGQTLKTDMWRNGNRIHFETIVIETNTPVITGAYIDLKEVTMPAKPMKNLVSAMTNLQSDAVFKQMSDYVNENPAQVKKINGIFLYNVCQKGTVKKQWTLDLKNGKVYEGEPKSDKVDTHLTIEDADMIEMALGKLNPQVAFMKGKLKIKGNIMLTQKLKSLLDANRAKL